MLFRLHAAGTCGLSALTPAPGTVPGDALGNSCKQVAQCLSFSAGLFHVARCLGVRPRCGMCQRFLPFCGWILLPAWLWQFTTLLAMDVWGVPTFRFP